MSIEMTTETAAAISSVIYTLFYYGMMFIAVKAFISLIVAAIVMGNR
jgi:hypothetical protein